MIFFFFKAMAWHFTRLFWEPSANCVTSRPVSSFGAKTSVYFASSARTHARTLKLTLKCPKSVFVLLQSPAQSPKTKTKNGAACLFTTSTSTSLTPLLSDLLAQRGFHAQSASAASFKPQDGSEGVFEEFTCWNTCWSRKKWDAAAKFRVRVVRLQEMVLKRSVVDTGRISLVGGLTSCIMQLLTYWLVSLYDYWIKAIVIFHFLNAYLPFL